MKVSGVVTTPRIEQSNYNTTRRIKNYGAGNDYPQKILDIKDSSGTGVVCFDIYTKFIEGNGFQDENLNSLVVNSRNEQLRGLLSKCSKDLRCFNGFAILIKYDGLFRAYELYNIPFEHCRLEIDKDKNYTGRIAVHPDWTGITGRRFKTSDIRYINTFNPTTVRAEMESVGGPENYLGQVYYVTASGDLEYPTCPFDSVVTDMLTEESVSTVKYRNAKHNFLPGGILVRKGIKPKTLPDGSIDDEDPYNQEQEASAAEIKRMQGDTQACKIWVVDVDKDEEKPEFIRFEGANYDRQYELTEKTVQDNIGKMNMIPPILRGVDVGAGFGAELMKNAYNFMNSVTVNERNFISAIFERVFEVYEPAFDNFEISPLRYVSTSGGETVDQAILPDLTRNERRAIAGYEPAEDEKADTEILAQVLGVGGTQSLIAVISDQVMTPDQKKALLVKLFNFTIEEANQIIGDGTNNNTGGLK